MDVKLVMFKQDGERKEFPVHADRMVIGRTVNCDLRIPLADISRKHAELRVGPDGVLIRDAGSTNGTYVNNKRVQETALKAGDHLVIGPVVFTVQIDGKPETIRPVKTKLERRAQPVSIDDELDLGSAAAEAETAVSDMVSDLGEDEDPISALEALASGDSSASGTALDIEEDPLQS